MKLPFSLRAASLIAAVIVVSLVLGGAVSYLFLQKSPSEPKFPPIVKHADLPYSLSSKWAVMRKLSRAQFAGRTPLEGYLQMRCRCTKYAPPTAPAAHTNPPARPSYWNI